MGAALSKAARGLGTLLGNVLVAPARTIFGNTCEGICSGTWDFVCFLENLCLASLVKLAMVTGLLLVAFFFFYLLLKVGIIQCVIGGCCQISWAACETYCSALQDICSFLWHKLKNTKRVYRGRRFYDMEEGYTSSDPSKSAYSHNDSRLWKRKRSIRERRKDHIRRSVYPVRRRTKGSRYCYGGSHHHVRLETNEVSVHFNGSRRSQSFRKIQERNKSKNTLALTRCTGH